MSIPTSVILGQDEAKNLDAWLMSDSGGSYSLQQLMEIAGLTVASAVEKYYSKMTRILIATGPGNNGGDGLVAARYLALFNHQVIVYRPFQQEKNAFFQSLILQAEACGVNFVKDLSIELVKGQNLLIDSIFGFGFKGILKEPFNFCIDMMIHSNVPIVSIDCPTGWTSEGSTDLSPEMLISLTAPKECSKYFNGKYHILGGRFLAKNIPREFEKLKIISDLYMQSDLFTEISFFDEFK